jgi:hypothetical protein
MYIYKTTFPNGKIYIGQSTYNDEQYFGSGVICSRALKKFGKENCKKEILRECKTQKQLDFFETYYIKKFNSTDINIGYNIMPGTTNEFAQGSPMLIERVKLKSQKKLKKFYKTKKGKLQCKEISRRQKERFSNIEERLKISKSLKGKMAGKKNPNFGNYWNDEQKEKQRQKMLGRYDGENNPNFGNKWSDEKREKMSSRQKERFAKGAKNPMTDMKRITNGKENTVIHKDSPLPDGWRYGLTTKKMLQRNEDNKC